MQTAYGPGSLGLEAEFGGDPFAFGMGSIGRVVAAATPAELGQSALWDLIELLDLGPGFVATVSLRPLFSFMIDIEKKVLETQRTQRSRE